MHRRLPGLDAIRGVAAIVVVFMHNSSSLQGGHLAVDLFFMLSGYVMARSYEERLASRSMSAGEFMEIRVRRLWPTMAAGALIGFIGAAIAGWPISSLTWAFTCALLLVPGSATTPYLLNLPAWSIFYELVANGAHAGGLARIKTNAIIAIAAVVAIALTLQTLAGAFPRILPETTTAMQFLVLLRLAVSYCVGIIIFRLFGDRSPIRIPYPIGILALPFYVFLVAIVPFAGWQIPFILLVAPIALLAGLDESAPEGIWTILGNLSFPLYAVHFPIMTLLAQFGFTDGWSAIATSFAVSCLWLVPKTGWRPWHRLASLLPAMRSGR